MQSRRPLKLVALGTSLTASGGWLEPLSRALAGDWGLEVEPVNLGGAGRTSVWGLQQSRKAASLRPDLALVEFSINDADIRRGVSLERSFGDVSGIIQTLRTGDPAPRICLMTMNPAWGLRGLIRPNLAQYYGLYRKIAALSRVELVDIFPIWLRLPSPELHAAIPDGLHPTPAAHLRVTVPAIRSALAKAPPRRSRAR